MRRSFVRLIVSSVLLCWLASFVVLATYSFSVDWTEERARGAGVFLAHELLDQTPEADRPERVGYLRTHLFFDLTLISVDEVEARIGRPVEPGERIRHRVAEREEWYLMPFTDGRGAVAAGPVNPSSTPGMVPIGVPVLLITLPALAGFLGLRLERRISRVERASALLAAGELSARVSADGGPTDELAERFDAMAERIERLVRSRDELVQAVSHELGSPLSRLRFHLELLETGSEADDDTRFDAMTRELDALDELVAELLTYVQSDDHALSCERFDPGPGLSDLAELAHLEAPDDREIQVEADLARSGPAYADRRLFQRAIENIIRNAVRYAASQVRVEVVAGPDALRVTVLDDGPGIPKSVREKVLIPFVRLEADRGRKTGGVGLGLAIVSRIIARHGGRIEIGDAPLGGAAVTTIWPTEGAAS